MINILHPAHQAVLSWWYHAISAHNVTPHDSR